MSAPLVSIMVPVYNRRELLADCLKSALAQTWRDLEVVVVDNASTDGTWDVCRAFARADSRVRIFRNAENIGPVRNWQRCFREAEGRYGKLLFSDDVLSSHYLEKTLPLMRDPHVAFVFTMALVGENPGASRLAYRFDTRTGRFARGHYIRRALLGTRVPVSPGAALFRVSDLRGSLRLSIPSPSLSDFEQHGAGIDLLLYLMTAVRYEDVGYVAEPLVFFRMHEGSITHSGDSQIADAYHQARIWFAAHTEDRWMLASTMAGAWLSTMKCRRRLISPGSFAARFWPEPTGELNA
ncbi:MAG TPA: glycosyltransferase family 2 protein [Bryobacteraceae bacterium]|nr:glycosyltransferase family 2 protein [Bryobacteraceae bacterium]